VVLWILCDVLFLVLLVSDYGSAVLMSIQLHIFDVNNSLTQPIKHILSEDLRWEVETSIIYV